MQLRVCVTQPFNINSFLKFCVSEQTGELGSHPFRKKNNAIVICLSALLSCNVGKPRSTARLINP